jgi:hypothetical protein
MSRRYLPEAAVNFVTKHGVAAGQSLHETWLDFYGELFVRFCNFSTIVPNEEDTRCGCEVQQPGMLESTKKRIVMETGTHCEGIMLHHDFVLVGVLLLEVVVACAFEVLFHTPSVFTHLFRGVRTNEEP